MSEGDQREGMSVRTMMIWIMVLITYMCWATAASSYFGSLFEVEGPEPGMGRLGGRGRGLALIIATVVSFLLNSLRVHHAPAVMLHTIRSEPWILMIWLILMACAVVGGLWVKKLEMELAGPKRKRSKRKRKRKRRPIE